MIGQFSLFAVLAVALVAETVNALAPAKVGEFPYQVSLRVNGSHACGGTMVGYEHIVTSAKCVVDLNSKDDLEVVTGSVSSTDGGEIFKPRVIVPHPDFKRENPGFNDIAVIALDRYIGYSANQRNIHLPSRYTPSGINATLTGWRWSTYGLPSKAEHLQKVVVKTITTEECQRYEPTVGVGQICASVESGHGSCVADAGAPLVFDGGFIGVLSDGNPCGGGTPGVFTSVYHHINWIFQTLTETGM